MTGASAAAIRAHYDVGDAFFALFLDPARIYSCALFDDPHASLEAAQRAKLDWHLDHAGVGAGSRLLDIGCGWGALMARAVERGASHVAGLTLSTAQAVHVAEMSGPLDVRLESWRQHVPPSPYSAIVSVGAFEHFAQPGLTRAARVGAYRNFFSACAGWLPAGGRLSLQTIAYPQTFNRSAYDASAWGEFIRTRIFPESDLPTLSEILDASEDAFEPALIRNDRRHYSATTRCWLARLRAQRAQAIALVGAGRLADMERYFRFSIGAFEIGNLQLLRVVLRRRP